MPYVCTSCCVGLLMPGLLRVNLWVFEFMRASLLLLCRGKPPWWVCGLPIVADIHNLLLIRRSFDYAVVGCQGAHTCHTNNCGIHSCWMLPELNIAMKACHYSIVYDLSAPLHFRWSLSCVCIVQRGVRCWPPAHRLFQISKPIFFCHWFFFTLQKDMTTCQI